MIITLCAQSGYVATIYSLYLFLLPIETLTVVLELKLLWTALKGLCFDRKSKHFPTLFAQRRPFDFHFRLWSR